MTFLGSTTGKFQCRRRKGKCRVESRTFSDQTRGKEIVIKTVKLVEFITFISHTLENPNRKSESYKETSK